MSRHVVERLIAATFLFLLVDKVDEDLRNDMIDFFFKNWGKIYIFQVLF